MEGRRLGLPPFVARRPAWLATGGRGGDGRARDRRLRGLAARAAGLAAWVIPPSVAPWIRARHCRAKIGGTAEPFHVSGQR